MVDRTVYIGINYVYQTTTAGGVSVEEKCQRVLFRGCEMRASFVLCQHKLDSILGPIPDSPFSPFDALFPHPLPRAAFCLQRKKAKSTLI